MSLINDALKRAQQNQPASANPPRPEPPLELRMAPPAEPAAKPRQAKKSRLAPTIAIMLVIAAVAVAGWTMLRRPVSAVAAVAPAPAPVEKPAAAAPAVPPSKPAAVTASPPAAAPETVSAPRTVEPAPAPLINPPDAPKLQGILYVPGKSSAIIDGTSVRAGDKYLQYRVKEISQNTVTLVDPSGKAIKLGVGN